MSIVLRRNQERPAVDKGRKKEVVETEDYRTSTVLGRM